MILAALLCLSAFAIETSISGVVFEFGGTGKVVPGARVCVLEPPNHRCVDSGPDGVYRIPLTLADEGPTPVTVVLGEFGYQIMRAGTWLLDAAAAGDPRLQTVHLQSVTGPLYAAYRQAVAVAAREPLMGNRCHIAGTVADYEKAHHYSVGPDGAVTVDYAAFLADTVHGFPGARVRLYAASWPQVGWVEVLGHGPVYTTDRVLPAPQEELFETSGDGGFFFYNLPEGRYRIDVEDTRSGHTGTAPARFSAPIYADCAREEGFQLPGVFVNLSPPALAALDPVSLKPRPEVEPLKKPELQRRRSDRLESETRVPVRSSDPK